MKFFLIIVIYTFPLTLVGQKRIYFERFGYECGLSHLSVNAIYQDVSGFMWFATVNGLNRFDGSHCKVFNHISHDSTSIPQQEIPAIYEITDSTFAVGTRYKLSLYNPLTESFTPFSESENKLWKRFPGYFPPSIRWGNAANFNAEIIKANLVFKNLHTGQKTIFRNALLNEAVFGLSYLIDDYDCLWIATSNGLVVLNPFQSKIDLYQHEPDNPTSVPENSIRHLFKDREGNIWVATYGGGVAKAIIKNSPFQTYTHQPNNPNSVLGGLLFGICEDKKGNLWIASEHYGVCEFKRRENHFKRYTNNEINRLSNDALGYRALFCDSDGDIWANLSFFNQQKQLWHQLSPGSNCNETKGYIQLNDTILIAAGNTLFIVHKPSLSVQSKSFDLKFGRIFISMYRDINGTILIGTYDGFAELDLSKLELKNWRLKNPSLTTIIDEGQIQSFFQTKDGRYWIGTRGKGLIIYNRTLENFERLTTEQGLSDNVIYDILEDHEGYLWMTTNKGLMKVDPNSKKVIRTFTFLDGLPNDEFNHHAFAKLSTGEIACGGIGGFSIFNPQSLLQSAKKLSVTLTDFKVFEESVSLDSAIQFKKNIELNHTQNFFSVEFASLSFTNRTHIQYAYKLDGIDSDWIISKRGAAKYNSVPHGNYHFSVKAKTPIGSWGDPYTINIFITPPFWKTTWFYVLSLAVGVALLVFSVKMIIRQKVRAKIEEYEREQEKLKAIEAVRARISADMHDDIGGTLTKISFAIEAIKSQPEKPSPEALRSLSDSAKEAITSLSEIVWSMNTRYDKLDSFAAYLREKANQFFEYQPLQLKINIPDELPKIEISGEVRHNLLLAVKEALNNILKHSDATEANLLLTVQNEILMIKINDNGKGFDKTRDFGNGLRSIKKRMETIHATCEIKSELGVGTSVQLVLHLNQDVPFANPKNSIVSN